ncbi:DUF1905 domain-containing protein [Demequina lutea]|uniref:DUF1905 domain-containing protein n=1 Tax=Demequina lutea TaxID=431489 RepID=A0A7Y9Z9R8_9MICO|nr:DUF1905 domain-containing protein [Demequina lutea]NYI40850.1 hypothetical protein [Demequina lutea]
MSHEIGPLHHTFTAVIGVEVKGEMWACVEMPGSAEFFGTGRAVKIDGAVDHVQLENVGLMVTGRGGHMLSLNAKVRKQLGKGMGDEVTVSLTRRLT